MVRIRRAWRRMVRLPGPLTGLARRSPLLAGIVAALVAILLALGLGDRSLPFVARPQFIVGMSAWAFFFAWRYGKALQDTGDGRAASRSMARASWLARIFSSRTGQSKSKRSADAVPTATSRRPDSEH